MDFNPFYVSFIARELNLSENQVKSTLWLLHNGATIPFIARYRKDHTGGLDEVAIARIQDIEKKLIEIDQRRETILNTIREQGKLTPELEEKIKSVWTLADLEDLYLPYKPKRRTRATIAREKGLEPLANKIFSQQDFDVLSEAGKFLSDEVETVEDALQGARDIIAELISEDATVRAKLRNLFRRASVLSTKVKKDKQEEGQKYRDYFSYSQSLNRIPSHRILAVFRADREGIISVDIAPDKQTALEILYRHFIKADNEAARQVRIAIEDSYKRLIKPSLETEMRHEAKDKADDEAIKVFTRNLWHLLMEPPLGRKRVLAIDPGFRTGCKVVVLNESGDLLFNITIYPHSGAKEAVEAARTISHLVEQYKVDVIALGNGTASRETEKFLKKVRFPREVKVYVVDESGASIYSASAVAREEFPDYDVTVRGAVSIGRRLIDPLAELVKIDPKSLGVGQYQHDVNQTKLKQALDRTVEYVVNRVGVDVNTASKYLLTYISGVGRTLAENIVRYRQENGPFRSREDLKKVKLMGNKAFEQAAGFLRIPDAENPLDRTAVHPESYYIVEKMAEDLGVAVEDLIKSEELRQKIDLNNYIDEKAGPQTLKDIMQELAKPGRDPRQEFKVLEFDENISSIEDLKVGMVLPGVVKNVTKFGAFVDIGIKENGLVHISELADRFVSDPTEVVHVHQHVRVKVISLDIERKRIGLSMKQVEQDED